ncbi:unnamed protein product [Vitrella brassicaformis CCMP3155]|uniref:Ion transport domain-containing protein n=1 Tax=Vitrella brassicaformis (strain CCMP3155) TaxID=1169540 RepID=A0A0G4H3D4_VITBC|nr:unnamed protein product [Vitrella brassicaformis CCMP3155]|eukprot:CEM38224.1 unnamed protein product [Vitrella brassicaformis CCMP3155]
MELLGGSDEKLDQVVKPEGLQEVVPLTKAFLKDRSESPGLDSLRFCAFFRKLMELRPKDSLTDEFANISNWQEALTANFCGGTAEQGFEQSLSGREREWFALLESLEPLQFGPRDVFMTRVLSMLLMVAYVLLHIESIKGDSVIEVAVMGQSVWLGGALLTGIGFLVQELFEGIRLKAAYWEDSWNAIDFACSLALVAFLVIHFSGWSSDAEVGSGILIALLFALRLLQTASLQPTVGPLILAVMRMFSDISMFLCVYVYILLVFAGVFTLLSSDEDHQYFGSFGQAMLTLFYAKQGDFNDALNNAIESHNTLGAVLLFTYVILSSIILASTFEAIKEKQAAQYQLLRIRVLNEYLTMPHHERLPPPFNLIAVVVSEPLRYLASLISEERREQSTLCCIAFWWMKALYSTVDGLLFAVAFTPVAIYKTLEGVVKLLQETTLFVGIFTFVGLPFSILLMPLILLCTYAQRESLFTFDATESDSLEMARESFKDGIDKWIEKADHHDKSVPDVMTVLKAEIQPALEHFQAYVEDEIHSSQSEMLAVVQQMDKRQAELEAYIKARIK